MQNVTHFREIKYETLEQMRLLGIITQEPASAYCTELVGNERHYWEEGYEKKDAPCALGVHPAASGFNVRWLD